MGRPRKNTTAVVEESKQETNNLFQLRKIERDENGLIVGVNYKFNEDGTVDWKGMVPKKFLYVNNSPQKRQEIEEKYGKSYSEIDPIEDKVEDKDLIIMLGGIKYILKLRGYKSVHTPFSKASQDFAAVNCRIVFKGNFETEGEDKVYEENACAHTDNTTSFYQKYLIEAATNRAFCRCVRNFLNIDIVSKEELGNATDEPETQDKDREKKIQILRDELEAKNINWEQLVQKIKIAQQERGAYSQVNIDECSDISDFSNDMIFDLIVKLKKQ